MLKNYLITAVRNTRKNLSHTLINVGGLGIGLACAITVLTLVIFEKSFDNWHAKRDEIYRITDIYNGDNGIDFDGIVAYPYGQTIRDHVDEIEELVEFHGPEEQILSYIPKEGDPKIFREDFVLMTGSSFFEVLDFKLIKGNKASLDEPDKIFLTETLASKYFGGSEPMGKIITLDNDRKLEVAGIVEDAPKNTNLPFECLVSIETLKLLQPRIWGYWNMGWSYNVYVRPHAGVDIAKLNLRLDQVFDSFRSPDDEEEKAKTQIRLQPLSEIHSDERYADSSSHYVTPSLLIYAFILLGSLILGTACLNFINLNTALAIKRSKEIGIRKTLGSSKGQLIMQFLSETLVIVLLSLLVGLFLGQYLIAGLNASLTEISYELEYGSELIVFSIILTVIVTLFAGFYPALILSGYRPVDTLKNALTLRKGSGSFNIRKSMVIAQFTLTTILIVSALVLSEQISFMKNRDMGFYYKDTVIINTPDNSKKDPKGLQDIYQSRSYVLNSTLAYSAPMSFDNWNNGYRIRGQERIDGHSANRKFIDKNYLDFYQIKLVAGHEIQQEEINDSTYQILVNETLAASLGWSAEEAIGKSIIMNRDEMIIQGVVKDFNVYSAHYEYIPVVLSYEKHQMNKIALRLPSENIGMYLADLESTFKSYYPDSLFELSILSNNIDQFYIEENLFIKVIRFIATLGIVLSAMGLYGLVSFIANRNAKAIGVRKVFGASSSSILSFFTLEYFKLIFIGFLVATPISILLINLFMDQFVFRIAITPKFFIWSFLISALISILTVGYRSIVAARSNPVDALRYE